MYQDHGNVCVSIALTVFLLGAGCAKNEPPTVSVGSDLGVGAGERVTLKGKAVDPDGTVQQYRWDQVAGEPVWVGSLRGPTAQFVAPIVDSPTTLTFRLSATDDAGAVSSDDLTVTVQPHGNMNVAVSGTVRSHTTHASISGASVTLSQYTDGITRLLGGTETDAEGGFVVQVPVIPGRLTVHVEADGHAAQSAVVTILGETASRTVHLDVVPVQTARAFSAIAGAEVNVNGQPVVKLPENGLVTQDGKAYTGRALAWVAVLDPSQDPGVMPGDFLRWEAESESSGPIESYGAVDVALAADNGARLQLGSGARAELSIPLARGRDPGEAPPTMPLYYWSAEQGYWIEEGQARLKEVVQDRWAYVGPVGHFSTWNADVFYESVSISGCVLHGNGDPVGYAELTARGIDYAGTSSATATDDGRFEIDVRPQSELELEAASNEGSSDAIAVSSGDGDMALASCLVVESERGLEDFNVQIEGEAGTVDICVRDHECEDGDAISVDVEGSNVFTGELVNAPVCSTLEVEAGRDYVIEMTALNGTGFKGACNFADINTGEIRVSGLNVETRVWRHREGAGSRARIVVSTGARQTVPSAPEQAQKRADLYWTITTVAGTGKEGYTGDGGPAVDAELAMPDGVALDNAGNLYIADHTRIRRVDGTGNIATIAGKPEIIGRYSGDGGPAAETALGFVRDVAVDRADNVYIAAADRIYRVDSMGTITTVAGTGEGGYTGDGGPAVEASLLGVDGVAVDGAGNVYIADSTRIRRVDSTGTITTIAGTGEYGYSGEGGPAVEAALDEPQGVAVDGRGNIYIADSTRILKVDSTGVITTVAGTGEWGYSGDGGPAVEARLQLATKVAVDGAGNLYIADTLNQRVRKVDSTGTITTIAGTGRFGYRGDEGPAVEAALGQVKGVAVDAVGNLYITDGNSVRKLQIR